MNFVVLYYTIILLLLRLFFIVFADWAVYGLYGPPNTNAYSKLNTRLIPRQLPSPVFRFLLSPAASLLLDNYALLFMVHFIYHTLLCLYTGCPRRNVPDFGRVFLMLKYTDITQNTYIQS